MSDSNNFGFNSAYIARMKEIFEERAERDRISRDNSFLKKGALKERVKNAVAFMKNGCSLTLIMNSMDITKEELLELAKQNNITVKE